MIFTCIYFLFLLLLGIAQPTALEDPKQVAGELEPLTEQVLVDKVAQECVIVAPATINLLGQVLVIASKRDLSFNHYSNMTKFKYIKYPDSFQATLLQVSNGLYFSSMDIYFDTGSLVFLLYFRWLSSVFRST